MDERSHRGREVQAAIGQVLLRHWDPIGVRDLPEASSEYEGYVGGVNRLLAAGASDKAIAQHLVDIETTCLGFVDSDRKMLVPVVRKLRRLLVRLQSVDGGNDCADPPK